MPKMKDLAGLRHGRLTARAIDGRDRHGHVLWKCECDCGKMKTILATSLLRGSTKSCGCYSKENSQRRLKDLTGQRFGRLVVIRRGEDLYQKKGKHTTGWLCQCDCGKTKTLAGQSLKAKNGKGVRSCGCLRAETLPKINSKPHGESSKNSLYAKYRKCAKNRGIDFDIGLDDFCNVAANPCHYCGHPPVAFQPKSANGPFICNRVDRSNSNLGYSTTNCVPCCITCNFAKQSMMPDEFILWIKRAYAHQAKKEVSG